LRIALPETDAYRASRTLESNVRGLYADVEIIDLMHPILAAFHADVDKNLGGWVEKAAAREQHMIKRRSSFVETAIRRLQDSIGDPALARP
jgi:hypothetical protein